MIDWMKTASISLWMRIIVPVGVLSSMLRSFPDDDTFFSLGLRPVVAANDGIETNATPLVSWRDSPAPHPRTPAAPLRILT